jgi:predicted MFS family arabinose efflux permease
VLAPIVLAESARRRLALDLPGALSGTLGLLGLVYGLTRAADASHGWGDTWTIAALAAGVVLLVSFIVIEARVAEPLMPLRILADRTRGVSFLVMMLVPAAMFAMFYFLSIDVQNGMGYSSLKTGFAFLPFSFGIVASAAIASNLMSRVDPRWLAGIGTAVAGVGLFGFSRLPYSESLSTLGVHASYVTDLLPWILVMSFGMGFVFVPLTVTAVHGVSGDDSGIGSGVLNAMQQIGGSLGLAVLSTVAVTALRNQSSSIYAAAQQSGVQLSPGQQKVFDAKVYNVAFTHGSTVAFMVGAAMIFLGTLITFTFMRVSHQELATDGAPGLPAA